MRALAVTANQATSEYTKDCCTSGPLVSAAEWYGFKFCCATVRGWTGNIMPGSVMPTRGELYGMFFPSPFKEVKT